MKQPGTRLACVFVRRSGSGLRVVQEILDGVEDVHFAQLSSADVVRHRLVSDIVDAYARYDASRTPAATQARRGRR